MSSPPPAPAPPITAGPVIVPMGTSSNSTMLKTKAKRMLSAGIPVAAVIQSMTVVDGASPIDTQAAIDSATASEGVESSATVNNDNVQQQQNKTDSAFVKMKNDWLGAKANRMINAGVPVTGVLQTLMVVDGASAGDARAILEAAGGEVPVIETRLNSPQQKATRMLAANVPAAAIVQSLVVVDGLSQGAARSIVNRCDPKQDTEPSCSNSRKLSVSRFVNMLKAGVPEDAVIQAMVIASGGISPDSAKIALHAATSDTNAEIDMHSTPVSPALIRKAFAMLKAGVGSDAVEQSLVVADGMSPFAAAATVSLGLLAGSGHQSTYEAPTYNQLASAREKALRMLNAGVSAAAVLQSVLISDGVDPSRIITLLLKDDLPSFGGAANMQKDVLTNGSALTQAMSKARRMIRAGVHPDAVAQSLIVVDGIPEQVAEFITASDHSSNDPLLGAQKHHCTQTIPPVSSDPKAKCARMLNAGVPEVAVIQALTVVDNIDLSTAEQLVTDARSAAVASEA